MEESVQPHRDEEQNPEFGIQVNKIRCKVSQGTSLLY